MASVQIRLSAEQHAVVMARAAAHGLTAAEYGRWRLLDEEPSPDGLTIGVEPRTAAWLRSTAARHEMTPRRLTEELIRRVIATAESRRAA